MKALILSIVPACRTDSKVAKDDDNTKRHGDPEAQKTFYGMAQLPGQKPDKGMKGCDNILGRRMEDTRGGHINELLGDLRTKCAAASRRLNTLGDQLERECEDPNLREWEYTTYPEVRSIQPPLSQSVLSRGACLPQQMILQT